MGALAAQLAIPGEPDSFRVAGNSWGACASSAKFLAGLTFILSRTSAAWPNPARSIAPRPVARIDHSSFRPGLSSWLCLVREKPLANRGSPPGWTELAHGLAFGVLPATSFCLA